ncbi:Phage integrase family protein [Desulfacinum hydrothermale DSM 13146]|uniref:Phage integrase family protein n=1 Tax=Desulfacinum hydrothermale DSM 13146 TaxID=1121390 RepID=A0A1W1XM93_9BACT|nr:Phage integrase family protein [Desulfacinum hydrothermale DSM 13146]
MLSQFFTIQLPSSSATARRDRLIANLVLGTGIRLLEFVSLDVDDVDLGAKHLYIRPKAQVP